MEWWIATTMELVQQRAPLLTDEHALDIADDLLRAWPTKKPSEAVDAFFAVVVPLGWRTSALDQPH